MTRKSVLRATAVAALLGALVVPARAQTTLKVNIWPHINHNIVALVVIPWIKMIEQATGGEVKFDVPAGSLAAAAGIPDAIAGGVADIGFIVPGYSPARYPTTRAVELPLLANSATALSVAYWRTQVAHFNKTKEFENLKLLGVFTHGPGQIIAKKPIASLDDVKGMKLRVGGGMVRELANALGVVAIAVPVTQAYEVLSKGVADGIFFPPEGAMSFKLVPVLSHYYEVPGGIYNSAFALVMNKKKWDALSPATQAKIEAVSGEKMAVIAGKQWDERDQQALKLMKDGGIKTTVADAAAVARLKQLAVKLEADWIAEVAKLGVDGKAALATLRAETAKAAN
jgi:TRAP-type C4-dicarboxylate transport system substrate-binding protein